MFMRYLSKYIFFFFCDFIIKCKEIKVNIYLLYHNLIYGTMCRYYGPISLAEYLMRIIDCLEDS